MIKINESKLSKLGVNLRFACMLLANVCDDKSMMPTIDGKPLNSNQLFMYFNMPQRTFANLYYELQKKGVIATIVTSELETIVLNPAFFIGYTENDAIKFINEYIFGKQNMMLGSRDRQKQQDDSHILRKRIKEFRKMGYIV